MVYRPNNRWKNKEKNNQGANYFLWGNANSGRHQGWAQTSQSDISGTIPEVALKLVQEMKKPSNKDLTLKIKNRNNTFTYSAEVSEGVVSITDIEFQCGSKAKEFFERNSASCENCSYESYSRCGGVKTLTDFRDYMKSYNNSITIKSRIIKSDEILMTLS